MSTPGERMAAEMAEQEAQEWRWRKEPALHYWNQQPIHDEYDGWDIFEAGKAEAIANCRTEAVADRILADHKAQQEVRVQLQAAEAERAATLQRFVEVRDAYVEANVASGKAVQWWKDEFTGEGVRP